MSLTLICPDCKDGELGRHCESGSCDLKECDRCGSVGRIVRNASGDVACGRWHSEGSPGG